MKKNDFLNLPLNVFLSDYYELDDLQTHSDNGQIHEAFYVEYLSFKKGYSILKDDKCKQKSEELLQMFYKLHDVPQEDRLPVENNVQTIPEQIEEQIEVPKKHEKIEEPETKSDPDQQDLLIKELNKYLEQPFIDFDTLDKYSISYSTFLGLFVKTTFDIQIKDTKYHFDLVANKGYKLTKI